ncbi:MAG: M50 family metallopeptidase [Blastocatellia bacterium]|nr:M50 family metallopeptidase [Blastocatellia bacterium]
MENQLEIRNSFKLLVLGSMLTLVLWFIPFAEVIIYPIRLFVTFIHEAGHALAALVTLGSVRRIAIFWSGSGVTETVGGVGFLISSAGYLGTTVYGAALLLLLRRARFAKAVAFGTGVLLLVMTVFFGSGLGAWATGLLVGGGCIALALKAKPGVVHFAMSFLAVQSLLNAFYDLRTLMYLSAFQPSSLTDAQNMANATGGFVPAMVWAIGWSIISLAILAATLLAYYRSFNRRKPAEEMNLYGFITEGSRSAADKHV